jgi:1-acyl-sn-glycerol-3-phosphate acyltransferase
VRSGAAVIAAQHGVPVVPIYVSGTHAAMPPGQNWPKRRPGRILSRRHKVEVRFGRPISPRDEADRREVMDEVRSFWERKGRPAGVTVEPEAHDVLLMHQALREYEERHGAKPTLRFEHGVPPAAEPSRDHTSAT